MTCSTDGSLFSSYLNILVFLLPGKFGKKWSQSWWWQLFNGSIFGCSINNTCTVFISGLCILDCSFGTQFYPPGFSLAYALSHVHKLITCMITNALHQRHITQHDSPIHEANEGELCDQFQCCGEVLDSYTWTQLCNSLLRPHRETGQPPSCRFLSLTAVNARGATTSH